MVPLWTMFINHGSFMNMDIKIFDQIRFILVNLTQQYVKRITPHDQVGFILGMHGWFNIWNLVDITEDIKKLKEEREVKILLKLLLKG